MSRELDVWLWRLDEIEREMVRLFPDLNLSVQYWLDYGTQPPALRHEFWRRDKGVGKKQWGAGPTLLCWHGLLAHQYDGDEGSQYFGTPPNAFEHTCKSFAVCTSTNGEDRGVAVIEAWYYIHTELGGDDLEKYEKAAQSLLVAEEGLRQTLAETPPSTGFPDPWYSNWAITLLFAAAKGIHPLLTFDWMAGDWDGPRWIFMELNCDYVTASRRALDGIRRLAGIPGGENREEDTRRAGKKGLAAEPTRSPRPAVREGNRTTGYKSSLGRLGDGVRQWMESWKAPCDSIPVNALNLRWATRDLLNAVVKLEARGQGALAVRVERQHRQAIEAAEEAEKIWSDGKVSPEEADEVKQRALGEAAALANLLQVIDVLVEGAGRSGEGDGGLEAFHGEGVCGRAAGEPHSAQDHSLRLRQLAEALRSWAEVDQGNRAETIRHAVEMTEEAVGDVPAEATPRDAAGEVQAEATSESGKEDEVRELSEEHKKILLAHQKAEEDGLKPPTYRRLGEALGVSHETVRRMTIEIERLTGAPLPGRDKDRARRESAVPPSDLDRRKSQS